MSPKTVAGPGEGQAPHPPPPLIFRPNWGPKGRKKTFGDCPPPLIWMSGFATAGIIPKVAKNKKLTFKTVNYWSNKFSTATLICNPFQSSSSLSIRAFFYIGCVFYTFLSSFEQLFLKFTQNMVAFNKNGNEFIISIALYGASYTHRSGALYIDC